MTKTQFDDNIQTAYFFKPFVSKLLRKTYGDPVVVLLLNGFVSPGHIKPVRSALFVWAASWQNQQNDHALNG